MAMQLIENLSQPFDPERYTDDYRANLMKVIKAKMKGKKPKLKESAGEPEAGVLDLMTRLRASLDQGNGKTKKRAPSKRAAASKSKPRSAKRKSA